MSAAYGVAACITRASQIFSEHHENRLASVENKKVLLERTACSPESTVKVNSENFCISKGRNVVEIAREDMRHRQMAGHADPA